MNDGFFQTQWLGNSVLAWLLAVVGVVVGYGLLRALVGVAGRRLGALAERRPGPFSRAAAAVARATHNSLLFLLVLAIAASFLTLPLRLQAWLPRIIALLVGLQLAFWLSRLVATVLRQIGQREGQPQNSVIFGVLSWLAQLVVWTILLLAVLSNAGVNVTAFVASLGVGGIAVALAAQNILGDLFASISIGLDKPFEVGEYIDFGGDSGTVKRVGIKSTRIQALSGEEISMANSALLQKMVRNYDRMDERRVAFKFRLAMDTPRSAVERIVDEVSHFIRNKDNVRFDRGHMTGFGEYSFDFEFVYYVVHPGFVMYRDIQQQINLEIMGLLEDMGVRFAVPVLLPRDPQMAPA